MEAVSRSILVFYIPMLIVLGLVTYIPGPDAVAAGSAAEIGLVHAAVLWSTGWRLY